MHLLQLALEKESNIDVIERIARLQNDERVYQARVDYANAFAMFQEKAPVIVKDCEIKIKEKVQSKYAKLDKIALALRPVLLECGITFRWKTRTEENGRTTVTCYLRHRHGHEERGASLSGLPDTSGNKNAIQADGSTLAYLERYTLVASCGIVIADQDHDGNSAKDLDHDKIVRESVETILKAGNLDALQSAFSSAFGVAEQQRDKEAMAVYTQARDNRRAELEAPEDELWAKQLAANETLEDWNKYVIPVIGGKSTKHQQMATAVARERGWKYNRTTKVCEVA